MSFVGRPWRSPLRTGSIIAVILLWQLASVLAGTSRSSGEHMVPSLIDLVHGFRGLANFWKGGLGVRATDVGGPVTFRGAVYSLVYNSAATIWRLGLGLALGTAFGLALAVLVSWSRTIRSIVLIPASLLRMIPLLGLIPLFALWFGNSQTGAALFVAFGSFAVIFVVALTAIGNVPERYAQSARALGAGKVRTYLTVVLPASVPGLRGGVMLAVGFGWSAVIAAESLGEQSGLGRIVNQAQFFGRTTTLAVIGIFIVGYAALSLWAASRLMDRLTDWAE